MLIRDNVYWKTGRYKEAKGYYEKALQFDPDDKDSKERLNQVILMAEAKTRGVIPAETIRRALRKEGRRCSFLNMPF